MGVNDNIEFGNYNLTSLKHLYLDLSFQEIRFIQKIADSINNLSLLTFLFLNLEKTKVVDYGYVM